MEPYLNYPESHKEPDNLWLVDELLTTLRGLNNIPNRVFTFEDLIRRILAMEFGESFSEDHGFEKMADAIKKGLMMYLSDARQSTTIH